MMRRRILIVGWVAALGLSAILPLSALFHGVIHFGPGDYRASSTVTRPVIAIGGDVILPHGSNSVVVAVLGSIWEGGRSSDDLVAIGGRVYLTRTAQVDRDVVSLAGGIYKAHGARATGRLGGAVYSWDGKSKSTRSRVGTVVALNLRLGLAAGLALLLVGTCLTIVFPWQVVLIATTLRAAPVKSGAAGLMSMVIFVFLVAPLALSIAGLPFALLLTGAASLAWLFGITASAVVVGRALSRGSVSLVWATAAGLVVLAISMAVPVLGPIAVTFLGLMGAGALAVALLSRSRPVVSAP